MIRTDSETETKVNDEILDVTKSVRKPNGQGDIENGRNAVQRGLG